MLDIDLQKRLDNARPLTRRARSRLSVRQLWTMGIAIALCSAALGIGTYAQITKPTPLKANQLGELTVLVSEKTNTIPADIWSAMERHIGKPANEFSANDQIKAVSFLLYLIEQTPSETINIW